MVSKDEILELIFSAVDEVNLILPKDRHLTKTSETCLFGEKSELDSLGLVNFIIAVEQKIQETSGISITLADERAMSQKNSPFRNIAMLVEYIFLLLKENSDG